MTSEESQMIKALHAALLEVPVGSPDDAKSLLEELRTVVKAYRNASVITRAVVWGLPTIAGLGVAVQQIVKFFKGAP